MSTAIYSPDNGTEPSPEARIDAQQSVTDTVTMTSICRTLRLAPTAIPILAENGDLTVTLPPPRTGVCPSLEDVRIVRMRVGLAADTGLLAALRRLHPPEKRDSHLWRATALGGILRVLGR